MASRTSEEVLNILRPRENVLYFGSDDSEEEVDLLEDHDSDGTEYEVTDLEDDRDDDDIREPEPLNVSSHTKTVLLLIFTHFTTNLFIKIIFTRDFSHFYTQF